MKCLITLTATAFLIGCGGQSIHQDVIEGNVALVRMELSKGVDVNYKNDSGQTPLHLALEYGNKKIAELLIEKGADINSRDRKGSTPLDYAVDRKEMSEAFGEIGNIEGVEVVSTFVTNEDGSRSELNIDKTQIKEIADLLRKHSGKTGEELKALIPRLEQHGRFAFSFDAKKGKVYEVQDSFDLLNWEVIKTYTGTGDSIRFNEERDHYPPQWFYRVKVVE